MTSYEKTGDKNIFIEVKEVRSEIHLNKLEEQIIGLKKMISAAHNPKTKPDKETLDAWNAMSSHDDIQGLETMLEEKEQILIDVTKCR